MSSGGNDVIGLCPISWPVKRILKYDNKKNPKDSSRVLIEWKSTIHRRIDNRWEWNDAVKRGN